MQRGKGFSLIEIMFVLVIASTVLVVAGRYYQTLQRTSLTNAALEMINNSAQAAYAWLAMGNQVQDIELEVLIENGLLPDDFELNGNFGGNPWGGEIKINPNNEDSNQFDIALEQIPVTACKNLTTRLINFGVGSPRCEPPDEKLQTFTVVLHSS